MTSNGDDELAFLRREMDHIESLEELMAELEQFDETGSLSALSTGEDDYVGDGSSSDRLYNWDTASLAELLGSIEDFECDDGTLDNESDEVLIGTFTVRGRSPAASGSGRRSGSSSGGISSPFDVLESALKEGVVPVSAEVGTDALPGDFGFDPLGLSGKDYFRQAQRFLLRLLPRRPEREYGDPQQYDDLDSQQELRPRPRALILRDYREAEIRHSRLAMLAAVFWPLQEMLDRFVLPPDQFGPLIYGPVTLPYFPLVMTAIMLLLGYLDIYSQAIKDMDDIGDAFLPGDCFWDPLQILQGAPDSMKRRMQERELFNGRAAMLAVLAFTWEEAASRHAVIELESNAILFEPAYQIPAVQEWLDEQFF